MFDDTSNICIFGMRGSGKSTMCRELQEYFGNVFIFDTLAEYSESDGLIFTDYESFADFVIKTENESGIKAIIRFSIEDAKNEDIFDEYIKLLYYRGNCTIVIEEVQNFASVHKLPYYLKQTSLTGRHKNISFITTTQRIAEIHKTLLSQAHHIMAGYTDSPADIKTLKEYGFPIDRLKELEKYRFIWKNERDIYLVDNSLNFY